MVLSPLLTLLVLAAEPTPLTLSADDLLHDGRRRLTSYDGHARLSTDGVAVDADRLTYDEANESVTAAGHVVARLAQGDLIAIVADVVSLRFVDGQVSDAYFLDGKATSRSGVTPAAFLAANTPEAIDRASKIVVLMEGNHLARVGTRWRFEQVSVVPCECDFTRPSWSIEAPTAIVDSEAKRVSIISPVVNIYHLPILWLPWLSLPLSNRQTGLLFPRPGFVGVNGFSLEQPVFVTLGRSADLTLTPGFFTGGPLPQGVQGVRLTSELRYALSRRAEGRVVLGALYDLKLQRDPFTRTPTADARARGLRGELSWWHQQDFDGGWGARLNLNGHSDAFYYGDITTDVLASAAGYLRSTALLFHRGPEHLVSADVTLRQDLRFGYDWLGRPLVRKPTESGGFPTPEFGPGTLQRFPALTASFPMTRLLGPLWLDVSAEAVRLAPLFSSTGDEGGLAQEGSTFAADGSELSVGCQAKRLYGQGDRPCSLSYDKAADHEGDRVWQLGEREARDRLTIVPRLHVSGSVGQVVGLSASAWWRQSVWWGEASSRSWQRGALVLDARAETELSRTFLGGWRHVITPLVAFRAIPWILRSGGSANASVPSSLEPVAYDEVDAAIPAGGTARAQGVVELRQRLRRGTSNDGLQLTLGQGVELLRAGGPALSESWGTLDATAGFARFRAVARLAPGYTLASDDKVTMVPLRLTRLGVSAALDDGRGHGVNAGYDTLLDEGNDRTRAALDLLFGDPLPPTIQSRTHVVSAGAWWNFGPVGLRYSVMLAPYTWVVNEKSGVAPVMSLAQHSLSVSLSPACDCWRFDLSATQRLANSPNTQLAVPEFGANVSVSGFGSIGTR